MKRATLNAGFTLPELLIAASIGSAMLGGLLGASIALQRGFSAAEYQLGCQLDQMRVIDYITRDLRRATAVSGANQNRKLLLTLPNTRDPASSSLLVPAVLGGRVQYGAQPISVAYYVEGDAFIREENSVQQVIATRRIENFLIAAMALPKVTFQLSFTPHFSRNAGASSRAAMQISTTVWVRNASGSLQ